jgi:tRNA(Ile)-lysidine synthetase-like protein
LVNDEALKVLIAIRQSAEGTFYLNKEAFFALPQVLAQEVLRQGLLELWGHLQNLENKHIQMMTRVARGRNGSSLSLPHNTVMTVSYDRLQFDLRQEEMLLPVVAIGLGEEKEYGGLTFSLRHTSGEICPDEGLFIYLQENERLTIGPWQHGEQMNIKIGHKKLSDILGEAKIAKRQRHLVPLVKQNDQPIWLVGVRKASMTIPGGSQKALLYFTKKSS